MQNPVGSDVFLLDKKTSAEMPPAAPKSHWKEYAVALCATLITATAGTCYGWPSPTLPKLENETSLSEHGFQLSKRQGSWVTSIMILCSTITPIPSAYLADSYGRKTTLLIGAVPFILGWLTVIFADSFALLLVARMFSGLGYGIVYTVSPMYTGEIATNEVRGALSTLITLMNKIGILAQYCIGPYVSIKMLACINLVLPISFFISFLFLPESPYYHLKHEHTEKAENALRRLRTGDIRNEFKKIEINVQEDMRNKGTWGDLIFQATNRKSLWLVFGVFSIQQLCGSAAIVANAQEIFNAAGNIMKPEEQSMILGLVQVLVAGTSVLLVDRVGRKPLLLFSAFGVGVTNAIIGTYFYYHSWNPTYTESIRLLPLICLIIFIVCYAIGLSTVPYVIIGEMFPTNVKSYASCVAHIYTGFWMFAVQKLFQDIGDGLGKHVIFWGFAVCSIVGMIFMLVCLPETKGRSFATIQANLRRDVAKESPNKLMDAEI